MSKYAGLEMRTLNLPEVLTTNTRQNPRFRMRMVAAVWNRAGQKASAIIHDLSTQGCKVRVLGLNLAENDPVVLRIPKCAPRNATVHWRRGDFVGLLWAGAAHSPSIEEIVWPNRSPTTERTASTQIEPGDRQSS